MEEANVSCVAGKKEVFKSDYYEDDGFVDPDGSHVCIVVVRGGVRSALGMLFFGGSVQQ